MGASTNVEPIGIRDVLNHELLDKIKVLDEHVHTAAEQADAAWHQSAHVDNKLGDVIAAVTILQERVNKPDDLQRDLAIITIKVNDLEVIVDNIANLETPALQTINGAVCNLHENVHRLEERLIDLHRGEQDRDQTMLAIKESIKVPVNALCNLEKDIVTDLTKMKALIDASDESSSPQTLLLVFGQARKRLTNTPRHRA